LQITGDTVGSDDTTTDSSSTTSDSSDPREPILAIDLDETIIQPDTEELIPGAKDAILLLKMLGWKIIIWTARGDGDSFVPKVLGRHGIPYDAINENLPGIKDKSRKIVFDAIVDNKNVDFNSGWEEIVRELEKRRLGWRDKGMTKMLDPISKVEKEFTMSAELEEELKDIGSSTFFWKE
jgi:hypothetical protein